MPTLTLRKIKKADSPLFLKWWADKDVIALTSGCFDEPEENLRRYFDNMLGDKKDHNYILSVDAKPIGHMALIHKNAGTAELTIAIGEKRYWGKGWGSLAVKQILRAALGRLGYNKVFLEVRPDNARAIRSYEKCGFVKKGLKKHPDNPRQPVTLRMEVER